MSINQTKTCIKTFTIVNKVLNCEIDCTQMELPMKSKLLLSKLALLSLFTASYVNAEPFVIGVTQNNVGVDSYQTTYDIALKDNIAANDNVKGIILDAGGNVARQIAQMQDLMQQNVDAIILWPTNGQALTPIVRKAQQMDIPVIITNSNVSDAGQQFITAFSGPNTITQGEYAADLMCEALNNEGEIVQITGQPGYQTAINRQAGFEQKLEKLCPDVEIIATQPGDWNREKSQRVMENFITKYGDRIDGVYAADDNMGIGALNAAKRTGIEGIKFIGATNFAVGYDAILAGDYYGSVYQSPKKDAFAALELTLRVLNGEQIEKDNYFDTPKVTKENISEFDRPVF